MLPTFVIGLREGMEAALIVGIVAAFLRKRGQRAALRWVWLGVGAGVAICVAVAAALAVISANLPQRQQEGLETVIGAIAVGMVTYMVLWMRKHSRGLKGDLEGAAGAALATGSAWALVLMAFLAVLREGLETAVFLLAAFDASGDVGYAAGGAAAGIAISALLGWGIYRGGVRINLARFFKATGLVLVLVAAGLVVTALHTAHEAGWLNFGQGRTIDLTWLVRPGSVQSSVLTGVLGVQQHPVTIEVIGRLVYLVPVAGYVLWPSGWTVSGRIVSRVCAGVGAAAVIAAVTCLGLAGNVRRPLPAEYDVTATSTATGGRLLDPTTFATREDATVKATRHIRVTSVDGRAAVVHGSRTATGPDGARLATRSWTHAVDRRTLGGAEPPSGSRAVPAPGLWAGFPRGTTRTHYTGWLPATGGTVELTRAGTERHAGLRTYVYTGTAHSRGEAAGAGLPSHISRKQLREVTGGRLPLGVRWSEISGSVPVGYTETVRVRYRVEPASGDIVDRDVQVVRAAVLRLSSGPSILGAVNSYTLRDTPATVAAAGASARHDRDALARAKLVGTTLPWVLGAGGAVLVVAAVGWSWARRRRPLDTPVEAPPASEPNRRPDPTERAEA